jgi:urease accessory protein
LSSRTHFLVDQRFEDDARGAAGIGPIVRSAAVPDVVSAAANAVAARSAAMTGSPSASPPATPARGWEAALEIAFLRMGDATILLRKSQRGPLAVQRPFSPEGLEVSHVTLLHPPGGLVGGDRLHVGIEVGPGAHAVITTPAAAKHYRSGGQRALQQQHLTVAAGGVLEWLPHETILFSGAISELRTRVDLAPGARFIGVDLICFGLPARGEQFQRGRCRQRLELWRGERPLLLERGDFDGGAPVHAARWGLGDAVVTGTLLAAPSLPADHEVFSALRALGEALPAGDLGSVTRLDGEPDTGDARASGTEAGDLSALCCRYVGPSAERGVAFLRQAWAILRPALLGRPSTNPRIWAT